MTEPFLFADALQRYVTRSAYTAGQLARLSGIPKTTIVSWLTGQVKRPRSVENLSQLAQILHLNHNETEELLRAAGYLPSSHTFGQQKTAVSPAPFQAIPQLPYFTGRKQLIMEIEAAIFAQRHRKIICLHGMGGVGKTALAAQLAYRLRASFPDGVLWAETNRASSLAILSTMAHGYNLDVPPYPDSVSRAKIVRQRLADKQFLLVLDDVQSSAEIADILPTAPHCTVLITTRRQDLAIAVGGQRFEVLPFESEFNEALALFEHILQRNLNGDEATQIQQIAQLLGQLPLALAIAASRLAYEPGWQIADFLARLQQKAERPKLLSYEGLSVQLSFAISYERLARPLQHFLAGLTIFNGRSFTDTAVAAIHQQPLAKVQDHLRALYNLSLLQSQVSKSDTRYSLHPLLSDCVQDLLPATKHHTEAQQRYVRYYLSLVPGNSGLDFEAVAQEAGHLWAALQLAETVNLWPEMLAGLEAVYPYLHSAFPPGDVERLLQKAERAADALNQTDVLIRCQTRRIALARQQAAFNRAAKELQSLTILTREQSHAHHRPTICLEKGKTAVFAGDWFAASRYYGEGVHLAKQHKANSAVLIDLWQAQANLAQWRSQLPLAESLFKQALSWAEQSEDRVRLATLHNDLAWLAINQKAYDAADDLAMSGLKIAQQIDHKERITFLLNTLSVVRHYQGDGAGSEQYQQASFDLARSLHLVTRSASIAANRGGLAWLNGRFKKAEQFWQESERLAQQAQDIHNLVHLRLYRAQKYLKAEQYEKALTTYQATLTALPPQANDKGCGFAKGSYGMALSLLGLGDKKAAKPYLNASLAAFALVDVPMVAEMRNLAASL